MLPPIEQLLPDDKDLDWLSQGASALEATKPVLRQVRDYLNTHLEHLQ